MRLSEFLSSHARGQGKTHFLAIILKKVDGTLIVRNEAEADRVKAEYGIQAFPFSSDTRRFLGRRLGITYVDPDAVGVWVSGSEARITELEAENKRLREALGKLRQPWLYLPAKP